MKCRKTFFDRDEAVGSRAKAILVTPTHIRCLLNNEAQPSLTKLGAGKQVSVSINRPLWDAD